MRLADKRSKFKLEIACKKALQFTASPSHKDIKNLFATIKPENFASKIKNLKMSLACRIQTPMYQ